MDEGNVRKVRLEQLLYQQKRKEVVQYGVLFDECVIALGEGTIILSDAKIEEIYDYLQASYPITSWARIDWEQVN